ncbi:MAG: UDP-N-acetylmuramoyl-tripeptide--D-alanyl-D-alanine ligase [Patescibacteria group bacterium]
MKLFLQKLLKIIAKGILKRYKPKIIGITGSVGKTGTKEAVALLLSKKFKTRKTIGNYNNEIGVPLTIIGEKSAGKNIFGWMKILLKGLYLAIFKNDYPEILILEMGIDRPGDMDYLVDLAKPDIAIISAISEIPVHLEFFKNAQELAKEKGKIVRCLTKNNFAILNYDDRYVKKLKSQTKAQVLTFGVSEKADFWADNLTLDSKELFYDKGSSGISFKLHSGEREMPFRLPYIFGFPQVYAVLAACAVGTIFKMNLVEIAQRLQDVKPPKGRMTLIAGIKHTNIIDDSYNASPASTLAALKVLGSLWPRGKKIAILGDMLELGAMAEQGHRAVGREAAKVCQYLVTVGFAAKFIADEAKKSGMSKDKIFEFEEGKAVEAAKFVQNKILKKGDLVLIKGSQGMRLERAVRELMAEPLKAKELLVRQSREWT